MRRDGKSGRRTPVSASTASWRGAVKEKKKDGAAQATSMGSGDAVYGLGMIGAWVYYWKVSETPADKAVGVLKGVVWPAFLVYEAFSVVAGRPESSD